MEGWEGRTEHHVICVIVKSGREKDIRSKIGDGVSTYGKPGDFELLELQEMGLQTTQVPPAKVLEHQSS